MDNKLEFYICIFYKKDKRGKMLIKIKDRVENLQEILQKKENVVLVFSSPWCGPGVEYEKIVQEVASLYPHISFIFLNAEKNKELRESYQVSRIPCTFFYKEKERFLEKSGLIKKTEFQEIIQRIG